MYSKHTTAGTKFLSEHIRGLLDGVKDTNFDSRSALHELRDMMDINDCDSVLYFETTKRATNLWVSSIKGPTIKLRLTDFLDMRGFDSNVFIENGSVLDFSDDFETGNLKIVKDLMCKIFMNDRPKDRIVSFFYVDGIIEMRVYKIDGLVEVGPRISATVVKILESCFSGKMLWPKNVTTEEKETE
jgi:ribosome biogenesis protein BRX1